MKKKRGTMGKEDDLSRQKKNIFPLLIITAAALLLVAGCAVGPDYVRPTVPEPEEWLDEGNATIKDNPTDLSKWWEVFDDPALGSFIEMAYKQNLPLQIAGVRILEARAQLGIAIGNLYPQNQVGSGGVSYNDFSRFAANTGGGDRSFWDYNLGLDVTWELDVWGRFRRSIESGVANLDATIASYDDVLVTLTADVATTYVTIRTLEERLVVARENVKIQARSLQIAEVRFENGEVTELDVTQARSLLRSTESLIPRLEASLRQSKNVLSTLLGVYPGEIDYMLSEPMGIPAAPEEIAIGIPAELLRRRPDIRVAERQLAAQSALIGVAKADLYPSFNLFGSLGLQSSNSLFTQVGTPGSLGRLFDLRSLAFSAGSSFTWNLFNYGRIRNRVRTEDALFQQLAINYEDTILRAVQEVEDGVTGFVRRKEESALLLDSVQASKRSVDLSLIQYREGLVSYQRVLDTQRSLADQQDQYTATRGEVATNLISVYRALGGGWESQIGKDFVSGMILDEMSKRTNWGGLLKPAALEEPQTDEERSLWRWPEW